MSINYLPLFLFVVVATFTPGPGNITSAGMGMLFGYRRTTRFLLGIVSGYLLVMMLCAFVSSGVMAAIPTAEPVLRIVGAGYLLWLAVGVARAGHISDAGELRPLSFVHGFCLQALNPKAIIFGLTLYTTFLAPLVGRPVLLVTSALLLAVITFCSVSLWAVGGTGIKRYLHKPSVGKVVNVVMAVLLIYCAYSMSGLTFL